MFQHEIASLVYMYIGYMDGWMPANFNVFKGINGVYIPTSSVVLRVSLLVPYAWDHLRYFDKFLRCVSFHLFC